MAEKTILVIDDDIDLVEIIRVTLENEGFGVIDAQTGGHRWAGRRELRLRPAPGAGGGSGCCDRLEPGRRHQRRLGP